MGGAYSTVMSYMPSPLTATEASKNPVINFFQVSTQEEQTKANEILGTAEAEDGYYALIEASGVNKRARAGQDRTPPIMTKEELEKWKSSIGSAISKTPRALFCNNTLTRVILLPDSAEAGFPHTRPGVICFPRNYPAEQVNDTFAHELVHIHQRWNGSKWLDFMKDQWGMTPVGSDGMPQSLLEREIINPDTMAVPHMAWKGRWVPMKVFKLGLGAPNMRETELIFWDLEKRIDMRDGALPEGWTETFGTQADHPFEMAAYYIGNRSQHSGTVAATKLWSWMSL
jgi:hypothetical protein